MQVFVVVTCYMHGIQDERVFFSWESANRYVSERGQEGNPNIIEFSVIGEMEDPGKVYTASWYDRDNDANHLQGVYGNFEQAKQATGERCPVRTHSVEP